MSRKLINLLTKLSLTSLLVPFALASSASAASGSLAATSSAGAAVTQGAHFHVSVNANADAGLSIVQAHVTYDASKLNLIGVSYSSSPWTQDTGDTSSGAGYYRASHFKTSPYPNSGQVIDIEFEALVGSGSTTVGITSSSSMLFEGATGQNILTSVSGANVDFTTPSQTPAPGTGNPGTTTTAPVYTPSGSGQAAPKTNTAEAVKPVTEAEVAAAPSPTEQTGDSTGTTNVNSAVPRQDLVAKAKTNKIPVGIASAGVLLVAAAGGMTLIRQWQSKRLFSQNHVASGASFDIKSPSDDGGAGNLATPPETDAGRVITPNNPNPPNNGPQNPTVI